MSRCSAATGGSCRHRRYLLFSGGESNSVIVRSCRVAHFYVALGATTRDSDVYILVESGTPPFQRTFAVWGAECAGSSSSCCWARYCPADDPCSARPRLALGLWLAAGTCCATGGSAVDHALHVDTTTDGNALRTRVTGHEVELAHLPIAEWLSLPMSGRAEIAVELVVPVDHGRRDYRGAKGWIDVRCVGKCRIGDDQAKLHCPPRIPDLDVGHLDLDEVEIHATIGDGHATITRWIAKAPDVDVVIAGQVDLAHDLEDRWSRLRALSRARRRPGVIRDRRAGRERRHAQRATRRARRGKPSPAAGVRRLGAARAGHRAARRSRPTLDADAATEARARCSTRTIRSGGPNTYEIDRELIDKVLMNPMAVMKGARVVPAMKNGKAHGFKLYAIRPDSLFVAARPENGDTIVRVNGFDLTTADQALELYTKLRDASTLQIDRRATRQDRSRSSTRFVDWLLRLPGMRGSRLDAWSRDRTFARL